MANTSLVTTPAPISPVPSRLVDKDLYIFNAENASMSSELTIGQLERKLSQQIQSLYREKLGHQPGKVSCHLFEQKLAIAIEDSITPPEQLLADSGEPELVEQIRSNLEEAIEPHIRQSIEEILSVKVEDFLSDATIETGRTAIVVVLSSLPAARNLESLPKAKKLVKAS